MRSSPWTVALPRSPSTRRETARPDDPRRTTARSSIVAQPERGEQAVDLGLREAPLPAEAVGRARRAPARTRRREPSAMKAATLPSDESPPAHSAASAAPRSGRPRRLGLGVPPQTISLSSPCPPHMAE